MLAKCLQRWYNIKPTLLQYCGVNWIRGLLLVEPHI